MSDFDSNVHQLYAALIGTTADGSESNDLVTGAPDGNGLEAWRKLHRRWGPLTGARKRMILRTIPPPPKCAADELGSALEKWIQTIAKYERRRDETGLQMRIPEDIKMAALEMLVPADLENHIVLNEHRLMTFQDCLAEVTSIVEARTGMKIKEPSIKERQVRNPNDMDIGSLGNPKGKSKGKDKGKGSKGSKGKTKSSSSGSQSSQTGTGHGSGTTGQQSKHK